MKAQHSHWDLFCTVVDNFGDIGICWRLARQLVHEFRKPVHLWVDDLPSFQRICPELDPFASRQQLHGVEIHHWNAATLQGYQPGQLVIEAFACELPEVVIQAMSRAQPKPLWLNLEYLSAEPWIDDCHGLPSHQGSLGLDKYFFFPGFTPRSGGLICEHSLRITSYNVCYTKLLRIQAMSRAQPKPLWLNLEYLSAEPWIDDCLV